jgi:hypothetical protein
VLLLLLLLQELGWKRSDLVISTKVSMAAVQAGTRTPAVQQTCTM